MTEFVISWLVTMMTVNTIVYLGIHFVWILSHMHITTHLPPPPRVDIQDPYILQSGAIVIPSSSDQQLGVILSIVEAAGSMA